MNKDFPILSDDDTWSWPDILAAHPELGDGLEAFSQDPDAGVVAAVGIFTILKVRFRQKFADLLAAPRPEDHQTDDAPPTQAGAGGKS